MMLTTEVKVCEGKSKFQLFFLKDDENQSVEVVEAEEIDFAEVRKRLKQGESVFITRRREQEWNPSSGLSEEGREPWYFVHV